MTPLQWLSRRFSKTGRLVRGTGDERWATCEVVGDDAIATPLALRVGLVPLASDGGAPLQLVSFLPLPAYEIVRARIFTRTERLEMLAKVDKGELLENSSGPLYLYSLSECIIRAEENKLESSRKDQECELPSVLVA